MSNNFIAEHAEMDAIKNSLFSEVLFGTSNVRIWAGINECEIVSIGHQIPSHRFDVTSVTSQARIL